MWTVHKKWMWTAHKKSSKRDTLVRKLFSPQRSSTLRWILHEKLSTINKLLNKSF